MLSQSERWVYFYKLFIEAKPAEAMPWAHPLDDIIVDLPARVASGQSVKMMNRGTAALRLHDIRRYNLATVMLFTYADQDVSDPAFANLLTGDLRIEPKLAGEGVSVSAHMIICMKPLKDGGYLCALERVPGVTRARVESFLRTEFKAAATWTFETAEGTKKNCRPYPCLEGVLSQTLADAMASGGTLADIQLVSTSIQQKEFDEPSRIDERRHLVDLAVRGAPTGKVALDLLNRIADKARKKRFQLMRVRYVKSDGKKHQTVDVAVGAKDLGDTLLVNSRLVKDFEQPLEQAIQKIRDDVTAKLLEKLQIEIERLE